MLDENFEYIKVIADCQKRGRTAEANQYSAKLRDNLATLARQAERQLPMDANQVCGMALIVERHTKDACGRSTCHWRIPFGLHKQHANKTRPLLLSPPHMLAAFSIWPQTFATMQQLAKAYAKLPSKPANGAADPGPCPVQLVAAQPPAAPHAAQARQAVAGAAAPARI